jgi:hypothetical protein
MKVTVTLADLETLLKTLASRPRATDVFTLSACAARLFVECKGNIGGVEALVFQDGAVMLPTKKFRELLKTYKGRQSLTVEAAADGLRIGTFQSENRGQSTNLDRLAAAVSSGAGKLGSRLNSESFREHGI